MTLNVCKNKILRVFNSRGMAPDSIRAFYIDVFADVNRNVDGIPEITFTYRVINFT